MEYIKDYFVNNFILLCIIIVMAINSIQKYDEHRDISTYVLSILGIVFFISIFDAFHVYYLSIKPSPKLATLFASFKYVLNPSCILLFILLSGLNPRRKIFYYMLIPLGLDLIVFILPNIEATKNLVMCYDYNSEGQIVWQAGKTPLRFISHLISAIYLGYLIYRSILSLKLKHLSHAVSILTCAAVVVVATVIEMFDYSGKIKLLNLSIAISVVFYYLYLYSEMTKFDPLTGLFNRSMYYSDIAHMDDEITGIIQLDMNGLKYINDTYGHIEGDRALETISKTLQKYTTRKMYAYRLGGDEFTVLITNEKEEKICSTIENIKQDLLKTKYRCSIGYACRKDGMPLFELIKKSDEMMYKDKAEFYKTAPFERRKNNIADTK